VSVISTPDPIINVCGRFRRRKRTKPEPTSTTIAHTTNPEYISDHRRPPQSTQNDYFGVTNADGAYSEIPGSESNRNSYITILPDGTPTEGNSAMKTRYETLDRSQPETVQYVNGYEELQLGSRC